AKGSSELACFLQDGDFMNVDRSTDWIWDWSSRPDQAPPKDWKFKHPKRKTYSIRHAKVGKNSLFSKEVLYTLFLTNFISLLLGTGVGSLKAWQYCGSDYKTLLFRRTTQTTLRSLKVTQNQDCHVVQGRRSVFTFQWIT
ncbi:hypothetical protein Cfor_10610, partial [Coptotermes formosanus]